MNYQIAINKLSNQKSNIPVEKSESFNTPITTKATHSSVKKEVGESECKIDEKSETMIEYLRTEIFHLRKIINKNKDENLKENSEEKRELSVKFAEFMAEIFRPGKDLIYQLCADPHLSESFFYKEDNKFQGLDPKYCLDVAKIFAISNEKIVDLKTVLDHKEQVIRELDHKVIELRTKFSQQEQAKKEAEKEYNTKIQYNFEGLDKQ